MITIGDVTPATQFILNVEDSLSEYYEASDEQEQAKVRDIVISLFDEQDDIYIPLPNDFMMELSSEPYPYIFRILKRDVVVFETTAAVKFMYVVTALVPYHLEKMFPNQLVEDCCDSKGRVVKGGFDWASFCSCMTFDDELLDSVELFVKYLDEQEEKAGSEKRRRNL